MLRVVSGLDRGILKVYYKGIDNGTLVNLLGAAL